MNIDFFFCSPPKWPKFAFEFDTLMIVGAGFCTVSWCIVVMSAYLNFIPKKFD